MRRLRIEKFFSKSTFTRKRKDNAARAKKTGKF